MGRATRFHLPRPDAQQMALVLEDAPELASHRAIVAPVAEASPYATATPLRFERPEVFSADEPAVIQQRQQDQQVGGQVRQFAVSPLVGLPALVDACLVLLDVSLPARKMRGQRDPMLLLGGLGLLDELPVVIAAGLEPIDLPAQARLPAIDAPRLQEDRTAHLPGPLLALLRSLQDRDRDQRAHPPVPAQHARLLLERRDVPGRYLQSEIEHGHAAAIVALDLSQRRRLGESPLREGRTDGRGQRDGLAPGSPAPCPLVIGGAQSQRERCEVSLLPAFKIAAWGQLDTCPIGLTGLHTVVSGEGQVTDGEDGHGLKGFIGAGERSGLQVPVAGLLHEVGHGHKRLGILPGILQLRAQGADLLVDLPVIFSGGPFALGGDDQALGEQGHDRLEDALAAGLGAQDAARLLHLAALLAAAVTRAGEQVALDLLPGRTGPLACKHIKLRPQRGDDLVDGGAAGIKEAQGLSLHAIGQADGERERLRFDHLRPPGF
ncbi:hypothetical protein [Ktedonobacter racemifer]|uniref:hypothetical protein n=1 Tax=Ktedonobacter racemifer TaxID=363277 RepID=UPI001FCA4A2B|nr:hypothetical protein [Ktedonobacter racemifer]